MLKLELCCCYSGDDVCQVVLHHQPKVGTYVCVCVAPVYVSPYGHKTLCCMYSWLADGMVCVESSIQRLHYSAAKMLSFGVCNEEWLSSLQ